MISLISFVVSIVVVFALFISRFKWHPTVLLIAVAILNISGWVAGYFGV